MSSGGLAMSRWISDLGRRLGRSAVAMMSAWRRQGTHCHACEQEVAPLTAFCPRCGEQDPARVAPSAPALLCLATLTLAVIGSATVALF